MITERDVIDPNVELMMQITAPNFDPSKPVKMWKFKTTPTLDNGLVWLKHWVEVDSKTPPVLKSFPIMESEIDLVNIPGPGEIALNSRTVPVPHRGLAQDESWTLGFMGEWKVVKASAPKTDLEVINSKLDRIISKIGA